MSLLVIDIGSSACKAVVYATSGTSLAHASFGYTPDFPHPSFAEMHPDKYWDAVRSCCRAVSRDLRDPVQALCLSSHGETFVAVDAGGRPLMNAILNQDHRAARESAECERLIGRKRLFQITGLGAHPTFPLPKILWLRRHRADIFAGADRYLSLIGYLLRKMGLPPYVDYSLASRYLAFDVRKRAWSDEVLDAVELAGARLPIPVPAGSIVGKLNSETATQLGLAAGLPVVMGGHDQPCSALGSGVIGAGRVAHSIGTYECLAAAGDTPSLDDQAYHTSLNSYCHVVPDRYVTLAYFPSGIMVKWFHDLLQQEGIEQDHYAFLEASAPDGPTGLCITPHLIGTGNPEFNPRTRGFIAGLSSGTTRAGIHKGILEGLACELSILTGLLVEAVGAFGDLYVTGGGARSALGLRLRAALTGCRLHVMKQEEAGCLGTAMLAGVAIGEYANAEQAVQALVREAAVIEPDERLIADYADQVRRYRQLRSLAVRTAEEHA
jgi:xylulokinase